MKHLPWLTHSLLYIPPLLSTTHTMAPLRTHTNMHRPTLMNTLPQLAKCSCAPAHLRGGEACRQSGPLRALSLHTQMYSHTLPGKQWSCVWDTLWSCNLMMKDRQPGSCLGARERDPIRERWFFILHLCLLRLHRHRRHLNFSTFLLHLYLFQMTFSYLTGLRKAAVISRAKEVKGSGFIIFLWKNALKTVVFFTETKWLSHEYSMVNIMSQLCSGVQCFLFLHV